MRTNCREFVVKVVTIVTRAQCFGVTCVGGLLVFDDHSVVVFCLSCVPRFPGGEFKKRNVKMLAISCDPLESHQVRRAHSAARERPISLLYCFRCMNG